MRIRLLPLVTGVILTPLPSIAQEAASGPSSLSNGRIVTLIDDGGPAPSLPPLLRRYTRNGSTVLAPPTDADPLPATTSRAAVEAGEVGGDTYTLGFGRFGRGGSVKGTGSDVEGGTAVRPAAADA